MKDFKYKGKIIGCTWFSKEYDDWCHEHGELGMGAGGHSTRKEATKCLTEDHLEYLGELEQRYKEIKKEINKWKDHLIRTTLIRQ